MDSQLAKTLTSQSPKLTFLFTSKIQDQHLSPRYLLSDYRLTSSGYGKPVLTIFQIQGFHRPSCVVPNEPFLLRGQAQEHLFFDIVSFAHLETVPMPLLLKLKTTLFLIARLRPNCGERSDPLQMLDLLRKC